MPPPRRQATLRSRLGHVLRVHHPAQAVIYAFAIAVGVGTVLLMLPESAADHGATSFRVALFTSTSALCVTGLTVVDTATHWSAFGQVVILLGIQTGGFGIMTFASLLGLLVSRRLGLRTRLVAQTETNSLALGDVSRVLRGVALTSLAIEAVVAALLTARLALGGGIGLGRATYLGIFHSVSAFNNAGFALWSDGLVRYVSDPWFCLPIAAAIILGGLGFPVLFELRREIRSPRRWSVHTKITLLATVVLLAVGTVVLIGLEWTNPGTLGPLNTPGKVLAGFFQSVQPRTAGFNSVDYSNMGKESLLVTDVLMFIGGGSASTAGGIKVTTFTVLLFAILAEARGDEAVESFGRRVPPAALRQALSVALLGVAMVVAGTLAMLEITGLGLDQVLFEVVSAFATVGLSTGITPTLPPLAQYLLVALMFTGRVGTVTLASALALRQRRRLYQLPEERPIIG